jgi:hypothetical protein
MPRGKRDNSNITFYKISCKDKSITDTYIGKTCDFNNRKHIHKYDCNNEKKNHLILYKTINENGGWDNWEMICIEKRSFDNEYEVRLREDELCSEYNATLNKNKPIIKDINGENLILPEDLSKKERGLSNSRFRNRVLTEKAKIFDKTKDTLETLETENAVLKEELINFNFCKEENQLLKEELINFNFCKEENQLLKEELKQLIFYKEENRLLKELFKNQLNKS